jgi:hypothetical protein
MQHRGIDDAEEGRRQTDPERERQHRQDRETRLPGELPGAVPDVLDDRFEEPAATNVIALILYQGEIADATPRATCRFLLRISAATVFLRSHLQMELELFLDLACDGIAMKKSAQARTGDAYEADGISH